MAAPPALGEMTSVTSASVRVRTPACSLTRVTKSGASGSEGRSGDEADGAAGEVEVGGGEAVVVHAGVKATGEEEGGGVDGGRESGGITAEEAGVGAVAPVQGDMGRHSSGKTHCHKQASKEGWAGRPGSETLGRASLG